MSWFIRKDFLMHSGAIGRYKIECDALTDDEIDTFAWFIAEHYKHHEVWDIRSVPTGGDRLQKALDRYFPHVGSRTLLVDDVLTTGRSMEEARQRCTGDVVGAVMFSRIKDVPAWIYPVFTLSE